MKAAGKGVVLAAANVLVIAIGISVMEGEAEEGVLVTMFGMIPGCLAGLVLGVVAGHLEARGVPQRIAVLTVPTLGVVVVLANMFGMDELVLVASIPSVVAALVLERWTRKPPPPPAVPVARVRAG